MRLQSPRCKLKQLMKCLGITKKKYMLSATLIVAWYFKKKKAEVLKKI